MGSFLKVPRTQILGGAGPKYYDKLVLGPEALLFGSLDP